MKIRHLIFLTATLSVSAYAAEGGEALFKKSGCINCHKIDVKVIGPSFKDIAAKYKGDKGAQAKLELKVRNGGTGSFGPMSMPPQKISDADIKTLVTWALSQK